MRTYALISAALLGAIAGATTAFAAPRARPPAGAGKASQVVVECGAPFSGQAPLLLEFKIPATGRITAAVWEGSVYPPSSLQIVTQRSDAAVVYDRGTARATAKQLADLNAARHGKLKVVLRSSGTLYVYRLHLRLTAQPKAKR